MVTNLLEVEAMVTNPREIMVEVENMVTTLLEEEEEEVEVMETAMVETITGAGTQVTNLIQVKNFTTERRTLVKSENLRTKVIEITNVRAN
jgi:hypothetical protein